MFENITVLKLDSVWNLLYKLAEKIEQSNFEPEIIIGISRGGLPVARFLSDLLENPEVAIFGIALYKGINSKKEEPIITQELNYNIKNKKILLVDDVADSGSSLNFTIPYLDRKEAKEVKIATIHYKPQSIIKPNFYAVETTDWIVYPWEYAEFTRLILQKKTDSRTDLIKKLIQLGIPKKIIEKIKKEKEK